MTSTALLMQEGSFTRPAFGSSPLHHAPMMGSIEAHLTSSYDGGLLSNSLGLASGSLGAGSAIPLAALAAGGATPSWVPSSFTAPALGSGLSAGSHLDLTSLAGSVHGGSLHGGSAHGGNAFYSGAGSFGAAAGGPGHLRSIAFPDATGLGAAAVRPATSVENLLTFIASAVPGQPVARAVGPSLQHLDSSALAALLKELGRQGLPNRAVEVFDYLRCEGGPETSHLLDIYTYTTAISVCSASQQLERALELAAEMRGRGISCNVHTYSALMNVAIKSNEVQLAQEVYRQMLSEGCTPNLVTFNTLIDLYVKTGQWQEAIGVLDTLEAHGIQPEVRTYNTIITACNKSSRPEEGLAIYERMVRAGVKPTATTYTALISAYGKQGKVEQAMGIFAEQIARGCERNVITYSSLISAAEKAGRTDLALQLFDRMQREGCRPNVVTYNSLLAACCHGAHWEDAERCFQQMLAEGCTPDAITYSALITAFERGGQWRRALGAYAQMTAQGCHPDSAVYNALLGTCWSSGVSSAQLRASLIWSAANRSGHFRIYHQAKSDPAVLQHSCVAFTAGAALVTLLRWLVDVRHRMMRDGPGLLRDRVVFLFQKGKACRVEQSSSVIRDAVAATLAGAGAPFDVTLVDATTTRVEAESSALAAWLRSPAFAPLAFVAHAASAKRVSVEGLIVEDAALEARCSEALALVRSYERLRSAAGGGGRPGQRSGVADAALRRSILDTGLEWGTRLGLKRETAHDAAELLARAAAAPGGGAAAAAGGAGAAAAAGGGSALLAAPMWRLALAACLVLAARQGEHPAALPGYDTIAAITGYAPDSVMAAEQHVFILCGGDLGVVSPLRVAHILTERLGGGAAAPPATAAAAAAAAAGGGSGAATQADASALADLAYHAALSPGLDGLPPTLVASALVYALRRRRGQWPAWPAALEALTAHPGPAAADFAGVVAELEGRASGQQQPQQVLVRSASSSPPLAAAGLPQQDRRGSPDGALAAAVGLNGGLSLPSLLQPQPQQQQQQQQQRSSPQSRGSPNCSGPLADALRGLSLGVGSAPVSPSGTNGAAY